MSDKILPVINGRITVTRSIRHDGLWSVYCVYYSNTGRGVLSREYTDNDLILAIHEFNESWMQAVIDFECGTDDLSR